MKPHELAQLRTMAIGSDSSLAADPRLAAGDTLRRQLLYAGHVQRYDMIVRTERSARRVRWTPSDTLHIRSVPAGRWEFAAAGFREALSVALQYGTHVVSCQDPISMGLVGYLLKRRLGLGLNLQINGDIIDNPYWLAESRLYPAFNVLARWLIRRADTLRVSTSTERRKYVDDWGIPTERVWNVPFMVDFSRFDDADPRGVRERLGVATDAPLVLFLGRLVKAKDLGVLLRAIPSVLSRQPRAVFVIAGSGPEQARIRELARELDITASIRMPGRVPYQEVPSLFASANAFVLCSHYEGTSMVTLEASASGLPVVSTDVTGARDAVLDGESGILVPRRDSRALSEALTKLLGDQRCAQDMGRVGREFVRARFDPDTIARRMAEMWLATIRLAA